MKFSRWCHAFRNGNTIALFHSISLDVAYLEYEVYIQIRREMEEKGECEKCDELIKAGFVTNKPDDDDSILQTKCCELESSISLELLYLLVTDACNLKCTYCFEDTPCANTPFHPVMMTSETVRLALDLFAQLATQHGNPQKKKVIHLYGGEPLVNRDAVHYAIRYAHSLKEIGVLPIDCQTTIVTNGTLLNEHDVGVFKQYGVTVGLSVDGPRDITNRYRIPRQNGIDVMERVTRAFQMLKSAGISVGLSVTLTPEAVANAESMVAFFTEGEFKHADGLSLNLLHYTKNIDTSAKYFNEAVMCQIKAFEKFRRLGVYEERVMRKARAFVDQSPMYADCGAVGYQLVIAPDGRIGPCQDFVKPRTYFSRSVYDASHEKLLEDVFAGWRRRSPFYMKQCTDCVALGICGGGCPASAELRSGDRFAIDERACYHSKQLLEWLIWDAYKQMSK